MYFNLLSLLFRGHPNVYYIKILTVCFGGTKNERSLLSLVFNNGHYDQMFPPHHFDEFYVDLLFIRFNLKKYLKDNTYILNKTIHPIFFSLLDLEIMVGWDCYYIGFINIYIYKVFPQRSLFAVHFDYEKDNETFYIDLFFARLDFRKWFFKDDWFKYLQANYRHLL